MEFKRLFYELSECLTEEYEDVLGLAYNNDFNPLHYVPKLTQEDLDYLERLRDLAEENFAQEKRNKEFFGKPTAPFFINNTMEVHPQWRDWRSFEKATQNVMDVIADEVAKVIGLDVEALNRDIEESIEKNNQEITRSLRSEKGGLGHG